MKRHLSILSFIFIKILTNLIGIIRAKTIAVFWGVSQVGILGQLLSFNILQNNFVVFGSSATLIININHSNKEEKAEIIRSVLIVLSLSNIVYLSLALIFSNRFAMWLLGSEEFNHYIIFWVILGPIYSLYALLEALNQAEKEFTRLIKGQIIALGLALIAVIPMIFYLGIVGVIIDLAAWYLIGIFLFLPDYSSIFKLTKLSRTTFMRILKSCANILFRNMILFISLVIFRIIVVQHLGIQNAGYFQSVWSITNYVDVLLQGFMVYFLPTISGIVNRQNLHKEISYNYELIMHLILPVLTFFCVFPSLILKILYTSEFLIMSKYLTWMAFGKIFEVIFLFYLTTLLSQSRLRIFLTLEVIRSIVLLGISWYFIRSFSLPGSIFALIVTHAISFLVLFPVIVRDKVLRLNYKSIKIFVKTVIGILTLVLIPHDSPYWMGLKILLGSVLIIWALDIRKYTELFKMIAHRA